MSLHKLTAGSGYDYLTRQVAVQDVTEKGHVGLASYYSERGEIPGVWVGAGCAAMHDDFAGSAVSGEQMQALFGAGLSPIGADKLAALPADATDREARAALRLGAPFSVSDREVSDFRIQVARRLGELNRTRGLARDAALSVDDRARIRTEVATDFFTAEHGRPPVDARELSASIARHSRPRTTAVAGFDLTFSPPKSVSTLWAVAEPGLAARIERAHQQAVQTALRFVESELLFSREGARGVRQVEVDGLVAAAFTHRDTRAGDPDLHTHVAVANKVRTTDTGKWLAVDGRVLYKGAVAASETYNTALVKHLEGLGLQFYDRPAADPRGRPVREIVGISERLNERWSTRRADIAARREYLVADFQARHGRPPSPVESIKLAQQATLETRDTKHEPRTLAEQRAVWHRQATETLGDPKRLQQMISGVFHRDQVPLSRADAGWFDHMADQMVGVMEQRGATWQDTHLRAEAQRRIRLADVTVEKTPAAVDYLVRLAKDRSVSLARIDPVTEPTLMRRSDGASVYTVHGAELFTSATVMAAEQAVLDLAERTDGLRLPTHIAQATVDEDAGSATPLTPGQEALVLALATSGRRLQLAIAPAGAGKTTAMHALTRAWTAGGGTVVGLAPSASAAAQLRDQTGTTTDTLAKLAWSIRHGDLPRWASDIDGQHLLIVDEAGMADTRSLATVSTWAAGRGASIRLIGDDQQLAAIGAGGILRDLRQQDHTVQLTELMRFADPAESAATLALRAGQPSALGFYLDHQRVHVGDLTTMTEEALTVWDDDRRQGRDSLMIAPTRAVVADLNRRARAQRLAEDLTISGRNTPSQRREAGLADGNCASAGDIVITRKNDRRLRTSRTDWVKNGDRWTVRDVRMDGSLRVQHQTSRRIVNLPRRYVDASVELGYACTIHSAQGVSVDTMHGVATGEESRQQLYTMLTRGRHANHLWLQTVTDGSPGTLVHPDGTHPPTPTDLLERILARDDTARSATTLAREQQDPRLLLGDATQCYLDGLSVAAEQVVGPDTARAIDQHADTLLPGVSDDPAWPALRSHLLLLAAHDIPPIDALTTAVRRQDLDSPRNAARDRAAVLVFRLDDIRPSTTFAARPGPLPWLPPIPDRVAADPTFGHWLTARAELITRHADELRTQTANGALQPGWSPAGARRLDDQLLADVEIWRAATQTDPDDLRPTGGAVRTAPEAAWKRQLDQRLRLDRRPALQEWGPLLAELHPALATDPFTPQLADHLAAISRAGLPAADLLREAISGPVNNPSPAAPEGDGRRPLPDDHAAAAVWWRITADLHRQYGGQPHTGDQALDSQAIDNQGWVARLQPLIGEARARELGDSPYWPLLVERIRDALDRGWPLDQLIAPAAEHPTMDACLAMACVIGAGTERPDDAETAPPENPAPQDLHHGWTPDAPGTAAAADISTAELWDQIAAGVTPDSHGSGRTVDAATVVSVGASVQAQLHVAGMVRDSLGPLELGDDEVRRTFDRADAWRDSPVSHDRMVQINQLTQAFFTRAFPDSWAQDYLIDRLNVDLTDHPAVLPGYALGSWTGLVQHLRRLGVTDQEMLTTGVARTASTGGVIDAFRDRLMLPIAHDREILGFVGRRHPRHDRDLPSNRKDRAGGPKYLNTSETPLFHKGDQFYGEPREDALPVIVEGPLDAIAVTLGTSGRYTGLAPLGTALTSQQAALLAGRPVILATDADQAGDHAAERDFWRLAVHGIDPTRAILSTGGDPAAILAEHGPDRLRAVLGSTRPQADSMIRTRLAGRPHTQALHDAALIIAGRPRATWAADTAVVADTLELPEDAVRATLLPHVRTWNDNPRHGADRGLATTQQTPAAAARAPETGLPAQGARPRDRSGRRTQSEPVWMPAGGTPEPRR